MTIPHRLSPLRIRDQVSFTSYFALKPSEKQINRRLSAFRFSLDYLSACLSRKFLHLHPLSETFFPAFHDFKVTRARRNYLMHTHPLPWVKNGISEDFLRDTKVAKKEGPRYNFGIRNILTIRNRYFTTASWIE